MRRIIVALTSMALIALAAGSAQAVSSTHSFSDLLGLGLPAGAVQVGNDLSELEVGDTFEVSIFLDNNPADTFLSIFTYLQYDPSVLSIAQGFADLTAFPTEAGFGTGNALVALSAPAPAAGQPAGTAIGIALGVSNPATGDGLYSRAAEGVIAIAVFQVIGAGSTAISHVVAGGTDIRTGTGEVAFSAPLTVSTTVIPEPGTALLMGLGLAGLASAGRRNA